MSDEALDIEKLLRVYIKIRDKKAAIADAFAAEEKALNEKLDAIEGVLLEHCKETGATSGGVDGVGTFYRSTRTKYWTADWDSMGRFIVENEATDLLERRIHQGNMKQFLAENEGVMPPGLNMDSQYTITVRRGKNK